MNDFSLVYQYAQCVTCGVVALPPSLPLRLSRPFMGLVAICSGGVMPSAAPAVCSRGLPMKGICRLPKGPPAPIAAAPPGAAEHHKNGHHKTFRRASLRILTSWPRADCPNGMYKQHPNSRGVMLFKGAVYYRSCSQAASTGQLQQAGPALAPLVPSELPVLKNASRAASAERVIDSTRTQKP